MRCKRESERRRLTTEGNGDNNDELSGFKFVESEENRHSENSLYMNLLSLDLSLVS